MAAIPDLVARIRVDTAGLGRASAALNGFVGRTRAQFAAAGTAVDTYGKRVGTFGKQVDSLSGKGAQGLQVIGRAGLAVGAGVAAGFGLAVKSAIDFESAFAGVRKTVDGDTSQIREDILAMAREMPASAVEIAKVAEAAGALGVAKSNITAFTKTMIQLGETTNLTADDAATGMARLANIFQTSASDIDNVASALVNLGNKGASTEAEILEFGLRLAGAGKQAGLSESNVLAFGNALASVGIEAEAGGTAFSKVFTKINDSVIDGSEDLEVFATVAGQSAHEFADAFRRDPARAIESFIEGMGRLSDSGRSTTQVFEALELTDARLKRSVLGLASAGDTLGKSLRDGQDGMSTGLALWEEYQKRLDTTGAQMEIAKNNVVDLAIGLGDQLLPAVRGAAEGSSNLLGVLRDLPGPVQGALAGLAGLAGVAAGVGGAAAFLGPKLDAVQTALGKMGATGTLAARGLGALSKIGGYAAGLAAFVIVADQVGKSLIDMPESATELTKAMAVLGTTGKNTGALVADAGKDFDQLASDIERLFDVSAGDRARAFFHVFSTTEAEERVKALDEALESLVDIDASAAQKALDNLRESLGDRVSQEEFNKAFDNTTQALARNKEAADATAGSYAKLTDQQRQLLESTGVNVDALLGEGEAAATAADEVDKLTKALEGNVDAAFGALDAEVAYQQAVDDLAESIDKNGRTLDATNQKGRDNIAVLEQLGEATFGVVQKQAEAGVSGADLNNVLTLQKQRFIDAAVGAGLSEGAVRMYADQLFRVPESVTTDIFLSGMDKAVSDLQTFISKLNQLPESKDVNVRVNLATLYKDALSIPKRQWGGPVLRGRPYLVGERGPELFMPSMSGRIIPSTKSSVQNANNTYNQQVIVNEHVSPRRVAEELDWMRRTSGV